MKYLVVGSGGTGTHLIPVLVPYLSTHDDDWTLAIMDGDSVEEKNLERQLFHSATVTMNKAKAATLPYQHIPNILAIEDYLSAENIDRYISDGVTIFIAVDNFPVRALIEDKCLTLDNVTVINGGNEFDTGSCQIWIRKDGENLTPPLSYGHPEIRREGKNRAEMSCEQIAELPGGEQLIVTNMSSAMYMLLALMMVKGDNVRWTEIQFDLSTPRNTFEDDLREEYFGSMA